jgi:pimeloyl-ACP methyl ester carboxylesterase
VLVLAAGKDTLIPLRHSQNLVDAIRLDNAKMVVIEQAGHNNISQFAVYYENLTGFL